jgi:hypothetical protein
MEHKRNPKRWVLPNNLHGVTIYKTMILVSNNIYRIYISYPFFGSIYRKLTTCDLIKFREKYGEPMQNKNQSPKQMSV